MNTSEQRCAQIGVTSFTCQGPERNHRSHFGGGVRARRARPRLTERCSARVEDPTGCDDRVRPFLLTFPDTRSRLPAMTAWPTHPDGTRLAGLAYGGDY